MSVAEGPQHLEALAQANEVRFARAEVKRMVRSGRLTVAGALTYYREDCDTMPVLDLITAQRNWGDSRARKILDRIGIPHDEEIGTLTLREVGLIQGGLACWER